MAKSTAGGSDLAKQEQRLAYWLLAPTFIILLAIAIYPLLSVLLYSFTNATFASSTPTEIVGLDNYRTLLSMTVAVVPPEGRQRDWPATGRSENGGNQIRERRFCPAARTAALQASYAV